MLPEGNIGNYWRRVTTWYIHCKIANFVARQATLSAIACQATLAFVAETKLLVYNEYCFQVMLIQEQFITISRWIFFFYCFTWLPAIWAIMKILREKNCCLKWKSNIQLRNVTTKVDPPLPHPAITKLGRQGQINVRQGDNLLGQYCNLWGIFNQIGANIGLAKYFQGHRKQYFGRRGAHGK